VIGWQTDNEFGGTHFWALKVQTWDEIQIPDSRTGPRAISNPSSSLDWQRFTSWRNVRFQGDQVRILRAQLPRLLRDP